EIFPFRGWRYHNDLIQEQPGVLVPPYDVITATEQNSYYDQSPYNYIRAILNRSEGADRYKDAAISLEQWKKNGVLIQEEQNAIYILSQSFKQSDQTVERIGCICSLQLTELGKVVLPHELTIQKYLLDRLRLMAATSANTGQIFMCYRDDEMILENIYKEIEKDPVVDIVLSDIHYRLWPVMDKNLIGQFAEGMVDKTLIIADGHHRYKTALQYAADHPESGAAKQIMVTLVNSKNSGMQILPTHRIISGVNIAIGNIENSLAEFFHIRKFTGAAAVLDAMNTRPDEKGMLGLYHRESNTGLLLNFKDWNILETEFPETSKTYRELDTNILHVFVLNKVFNIDSNKQTDLNRVAYMRGNEPALDMLKKEHHYDVACFVNPPSLEDVYDIAKSGETMPQKSTFFFPKIYSGLVTRCF
ncbi:MAG: DUF1015 domain-containing protein, partial [Candidatus Neomarinimicrobiota bacterium]|nr:DUF1015 domain-containing protein [Candidatus Neomarinimicrobiota bacterium]